jgi:hypothetical protein
MTKAQDDFRVAVITAINRCFEQDSTQTTTIESDLLHMRVMITNESFGTVRLLDDDGDTDSIYTLAKDYGGENPRILINHRHIHSHEGLCLKNADRVPCFNYPASHYIATENDDTKDLS